VKDLYRMNGTSKASRLLNMRSSSESMRTSTLWRWTTCSKNKEELAYSVERTTFALNQCCASAFLENDMGVSPEGTMKLISTRGRGAAQTHEVLAALERRVGGTGHCAANCPTHCDRCAQPRRSCAAQVRCAIDGLAGADCVRVTEQEMAAAWKSVSPELRDALSTAAKQIRTLPGTDAGFVEFVSAPG